MSEVGQELDPQEVGVPRAVDCYIRDGNGSLIVRIGVAVPNLATLADVTVAVMSVCNIRKEPPPHQSSGSHTSTNSSLPPQNSVSEQIPFQVPTTAATGKSRSSPTPRPAHTMSSTTTYASVTRGGASGPGNDQRRVSQMQPIQQTEEGSPGPVMVDLIDEDRTATYEQHQNRSRVRDNVEYPQAVMKTMFVDSRNKEHWQSNEEWKGLIKGGKKLSVGLIVQLANAQFPEARLRVADYLSPTGKPQLHLWFRVDISATEGERADEIMPFMDHLTTFIGPLESLLLPPKSYGLVRSKVHPATTQTRTRVVANTARVVATSAGGTDDRRPAQDWPVDQQGRKYRLEGCVKGLSYPAMKRHLAEGKLDERRVFLQYLDPAKTQLGLSFTKHASEEEMEQTVEILKGVTGATEVRDNRSTSSEAPEDPDGLEESKGQRKRKHANTPPKETQQEQEEQPRSQAAPTEDGKEELAAHIPTMVELRARQVEEEAENGLHPFFVTHQASKPTTRPSATSQPGQVNDKPPDWADHVSESDLS